MIHFVIFGKMIPNNGRRYYFCIRFKGNFQTLTLLHKIINHFFFLCIKQQSLLFLYKRVGTSTWGT